MSKLGSKERIPLEIVQEVSAVASSLPPNSNNLAAVAEFTDLNFISKPSV